MTRGTTLAFVATPIKVGDLVTMLSGDEAKGMELVVNGDGGLEIRA